MAMRGRGAGLFQGLKARDELRQKDEQLAIQRKNAETSAMQAASSGSGAFWTHQTASERNDLERQRLEMAQRKQDDAAVRDDFLRRAQEMKLESETAEAQKLAELNRQEVERMQNRRQMYETIEGEAFFATATSGMFSDDGSIKTNTPAFEKELARRLGVKRASAYLDKNGFHIRYESNNGKIGTRDFDTNWCKSQSLYWSGDASMFGGGRLGKDGREQLGEEQRQAMEVAGYGRKKAIDQEMYLQNRYDMNLQDVMRRISIEVGKQEMTPEEGEKAIEFYRQEVAKSAPKQNGGTDAAKRDELAALIAERERRAAAKGDQRNIPGMPKRQQEQPTPAQTQQQTQQPAPKGEEAAAEPAQGKDRAAAIAQLAKDTGLDEGHAERAYNVALSQYKASQRRGGNRSFESFLNAQATWMMTHGRQNKGRTGRR